MKRKKKPYHQICISVKEKMKSEDSKNTKSKSKIQLAAFEDPDDDTDELEVITYQDLLLRLKDLPNDLGFIENEVTSEKWLELIDSCNYSQIVAVREQMKKDFSSFEEKLRFVLDNLAYLKNEEIYNFLMAVFEN